MEFICVLSVSGSLASYAITKQSENTYKATLKTGAGKRNDIPETISLSRDNGSWNAEPWHDEIIPSLTHCIEAAA